MQWQKLLLAGLLLAFLLSPAFGAEISSPEQLPAGVAWSFSIALDPSNAFTKAIVSIDNSEIVQAFSNSQISIDPFNGGQVIKAFIVDADPNSTAGLLLYTSHIGLGTGQHAIKVVVMNNTETLSTKEKAITVVDVLPGSFEQQFKEKLGYLETNLNTKVDNANAKIDATAQQLATQTEQLKAGVSESAKKASEALSLTSSLEQALLKIQSEADKKIGEKFSALQPELPEQSKPSLATAIPLFSLGSFPVTNLAMLVVAVVVVFAAAFFLKTRFFDKSGVHLPEFESALEQVSVPKDYSQENADEILRMTSKGKWAHETKKD